MDEITADELVKNINNNTEYQYTRNDSYIISKKIDFWNVNIEITFKLSTYQQCQKIVREIGTTMIGQYPQDDIPQYKNIPDTIIFEYKNDIDGYAYTKTTIQYKYDYYILTYTESYCPVGTLEFIMSIANEFLKYSDKETSVEWLFAVKPLLDNVIAVDSISFLIMNYLL